jgi:hypothetical protein
MPKPKPQSKKPEKPEKPKKPKPLYKFMPLPPGFNPVDATIDEVASFRRESRWTVHVKLKDGRYEGYLDGRIHKVIFASVLADRARTIAATSGKFKPPVKQPVGRPKRKVKPESRASRRIGAALCARTISETTPPGS